MNHEITIGQMSDGTPVKLDVSRLITSRLLATASSGGGKSWLLRRILELVSKTTQTIVIDPEGEFATLREKRDMVLVGPAGEMAADPRSASLLCRKLMELNLSAVIDVGDLPLHDRKLFVANFCNTMVDLPRSLWRPCFVAVDETHEYAAEGDESVSGKALSLLSSKGRKRGYCLLGATQRLAKLDKNVAAELKNTFIGQMQQDTDLARSAGSLGFAKNRWPEIRDLSPPGDEGEFFAFGPALNHRGVVKFRVGMVETTHPRAGQGKLAEPPAPSKKIQGVLSEFKDLAQQAEAEIKDVAAAKKKIGELERQLAQRPKEQVEKIIEKIVEVPVLKNGQLDRTEKVIERLELMLGKVQTETTELRRLIAPSATPRPVPQKATVAVARPAMQRAIVSRGSGVADGTLGKAEKRILIALAQYAPNARTKKQIAVLASYAVNGGGFNNAMGSLRSKNLIEGSDPITITQEGIDALGEFAPLPHGAELLEHWKRQLGKAENEILSVLVSAYPSALDKEAIAAATESQYASSGGGFNNALGRLRTFELVSTNKMTGLTAASADLFD